MATIRIPEQIYSITREHLFSRPGEHFAFFLASWSWSNHKPVFLVRDVILIPDDQTSGTWDHMEITTDGFLLAINKAVKIGCCLIEIHNHGGSKPRFSLTDREGFDEFVPYVLDSIKGRPYAATVWGDYVIYGEYFLADGGVGIINSITVFGDQLQQVVSLEDDLDPTDSVFDRQMPWFTEAGHKQIERMRVGIVGLGGTGSQVVQELSYLGCQNYVLIDSDVVEATNLNRLVTASRNDTGLAKVKLAQDLIQKVTDQAQISTFPTMLQDEAALNALFGVDVIFGCVDNDGARLVLNELALAYNIPYIDMGVGIDANSGLVSAAGGYVSVVLPGGPCLLCMKQIDTSEANYFLSSQAQQDFQRDRGYIEGTDNAAPAVVSLNALISAAAVNEFLVYMSGIRPVNPFAEYDLIGVGRSTKSQWVTPIAVEREEGCVHCILASEGDQLNILRYSQYPTIIKM